jgi:hypothetical protein
MKVLSVKNPWAYLIMHHGKDIENRTYKTNFRGEVLIHASLKSACFEDYASIMPEHFQYNDLMTMLTRAEPTNGCILGSIRIVDCVQDSQSGWAEPGLWHWVLENPTLLPEPIPAKGMLGFWQYIPLCKRCRYGASFDGIFVLPYCKETGLTLQRDQWFQKSCSRYKEKSGGLIC